MLIASHHAPRLEVLETPSPRPKAPAAAPRRSLRQIRRVYVFRSGGCASRPAAMHPRAHGGDVERCTGPAATSCSADAAKGACAAAAGDGQVRIRLCRCMRDAALPGTESQGELLSLRFLFKSPQCLCELLLMPGQALRRLACRGSASESTWCCVAAWRCSVAPSSS